MGISPSFQLVLLEDGILACSFLYETEHLGFQLRIDIVDCIVRCLVFLDPECRFLEVLRHYLECTFVEKTHYVGRGQILPFFLDLARIDLEDAAGLPQIPIDRYPAEPLDILHLSSQELFLFLPGLTCRTDGTDTEKDEYSYQEKVEDIEEEGYKPVFERLVLFAFRIGVVTAFHRGLAHLVKSPFFGNGRSEHSLLETGHHDHRALSGELLGSPGFDSTF